MFVYTTGKDGRAVKELAPYDTTKCTMCKRPLSDDPNSRRYNCGGDCLECMAACGDPDCIKSLKEIDAKEV